MSSSNCCFLTCIQVSQESGQVVWYAHLFQNSTVYCDPHSQRLWYSQSRNRCFSGILLLFLMLAIWSLVSLPFLKPVEHQEVHGSHIAEACLENFEHYFISVWDECNCTVVWAFFGIAFLWDWNENWPFPVLWPLLSFPKLLTLSTALSQYHLLGLWD